MWLWMQLTPIPKKVLAHSIILRSRYDNLGDYGYLADETINHVRVQFDKRTNYIDGANVTTIENILFVDVVNSEYSDINKFTIDSIIKFNEREYRVSSIEYIEAYSELHHLEVTLV